MVFLVLDLVKLGTRNEYCNIFVLDYLGFVESNIINDCDIEAYSEIRVWPWHNALAKDSLKSFFIFFLSFHLILCDWFCRFRIVL